ncbi:uncharacterized protein LOC143048227 isoform X2 [Mytilus galloprovincialis]|uniref:uncharacterized protein LOC143048227 isoform X2 n=1 Tax=Mytilus galloprovincialis TaxID=29158 RepID=UPI003F7C045B
MGPLTGKIDEKTEKLEGVGTLPPILPLIQQSGLQALSQVLASIPTDNPLYTSQLSEQVQSVTYSQQPLSPQIPDSQQLQAQLLATLHQQNHSQNLNWNESIEYLLPQDKECSDKMQAVQAVSKSIHKKLGQDGSLEDENESSTNDIQEIDDSIGNTEIRCLPMTSVKSKSRSGKNKPRTSKKSQKIKQLLSHQVKIRQDKHSLVAIAPKEVDHIPGNSTSPERQNSSTNSSSTLPKNTLGVQNSTSVCQTLASSNKPSQLFASNLMRKVLLQDMMSNTHTEMSSPMTGVSVTNLIQQVIPSASVSSLQSDPVTNPALSRTTLSTTGLNTVGLAGNSPALPSVQSLNQFMPIAGFQSAQSLQGPHATNLQPTVAHMSGTNTSVPSMNNFSLPFGNVLPGLPSVQNGLTLSSATGIQTTPNITQLSPSSLSVITSLIGQLVNSESTQHGKDTELSVTNKQSHTLHSLPLIENEMTLSTEGDNSEKAHHTDDSNSRTNQQIPVAGSQQNDMSAFEPTTILQQEKQPGQPGSILIKSTSGENVTVNYQHIQSVLSSLISSLQGQLDATRKLYSPIMSTSVQNGSSHAQIGSGLNQPILDITGSNQLPDIPYSFVPLPINPIQPDHQNNNTVDQNILSCNSAVEIAQNLTCETRTCHQTTPNQTIRNSIDVDGHLINESDMTGGNQIEGDQIGHVGDRLVDESFLSEQSEALYEEQHFLYNKSIDFLNSRGHSSSVTINNIEEGLVNHDTMHLTDDSGCQDITESNTLKAQMLLTQDQEEDFTDVPNMFKQYCLSCKAAMLNEDCQFHKIGYNHIKDTPILSKARTSIPSCLTLQPTSTFGYNVYLGVWTKENIPAHTKFGPLAGKIESECERNSETVQCFPAWKIFLETRSEMIDGSDENECNWMMFLKPARCEKTQNLIAHQLGRHIYFFTTKEVFCGQELLYWFSKEYATLSGYPCQPGEASLSECPICGKVFIDKSTRKLHMKEHPHYQKFKCHICDHLYSSLSSLKRHTMLHMGVKPHICHVCHKTFNDSSNLKVHLKVHTGMKVFTCNICQKTFRQKAHLKTHLLIHTGQKNLKCYFCDKTFAREGDRKQHEYQHTKEKTFKCEECGKVFYKLQNYKRHLLIHTGVRDFECQFCMKTFGRKFHLQRHMEKCQARNEIFEEKDLILNNVDLKGILNS